MVTGNLIRRQTMKKVVVDAKQLSTENLDDSDEDIKAPDNMMGALMMRAGTIRGKAPTTDLDEQDDTDIALTVPGIDISDATK